MRDEKEKQNNNMLKKSSWGFFKSLKEYIPKIKNKK